MYTVEHLTTEGAWYPWDTYDTKEEATKVVLWLWAEFNCPARIVC